MLNRLGRIGPAGRISAIRRLRHIETAELPQRIGGVNASGQVGGGNEAGQREARESSGG